MPPLTQPQPLQTSRASVSVILCIVLVLLFSLFSAGGVYMFLQKRNVVIPPQTVDAPVAATVTPSAKDAENTALLFVKEITTTSTSKVSVATIPSLALLLGDDMYKATLIPDTEVAHAVSFSTTTTSLGTSGTAISGNTSSVQVQACYDTSCFKAYHYYITLVVENDSWAVAGASFAPEARE